jgi:hypothetical protein
MTYEAPALEPLREQAQSIAVPPQDLHSIATPAAEHEQLPRERILVQAQLHERRQSIKALPHVRHPAGEPDLGSRRQPDHRRASALSTAVSRSPATSPITRTRAPHGSSISIVDVTAAEGEALAATCTGSIFAARGGRVRSASTPC